METFSVYLRRTLWNRWQALTGLACVAFTIRSVHQFGAPKAAVIAVLGVLTGLTVSFFKWRRLVRGQRWPKAEHSLHDGLGNVIVKPISPDDANNAEERQAGP